ncbi:MAG: hypothetical protein QOC95_1379 [Thermoleophilaceae bacterium]|jgi:uncharacterized protein YbcI|nr:hypothetical protein [Thermoleophilaceae bacterium]
MQERDVHPRESADEKVADGRQLLAISNELVSLHARFYGRGPTKARTLMVEDIVISRLSDPFTTAERTLLRTGREAEVRNMRAAFQSEMEAQFTDVVERAVGRRVIGFISEIHVDPDMAIELFFLEPESNGQRP